MRDRITYEWVFEEVDEWGDIVDPLFEETLKAVLRYKPETKGNEGKVALVRNEGSNENGLNVREYAYLEDGKLPKEFDDGYRVPMRYHKEVANEFDRA